MRRIENNELLKIGTEVQVKGLRGKVVAAEIVPAHPCGTVALHTIEYNEKQAATRIGVAEKCWLKMKKPIIRKANYSFIYVDENT